MNWDLCFPEKKSCQHQETSIVLAGFGIPSVWGSHNDKFQEKYFEIKLFFFDPEETRLVKRNWYPQNEKHFSA